MSHPPDRRGRRGFAVAAVLWLPLLALDLGYPSLAQVVDSPVLLRAAAAAGAVAVGVAVLLPGLATILSRTLGRWLDPPVDVSVAVIGGSAALAALALLGGGDGWPISALATLLGLLVRLPAALAAGCVLAAVAAALGRRTRRPWPAAVVALAFALLWAALTAVLTARSGARELAWIAWPLAAAAWLVAVEPGRRAWMPRTAAVLLATWATAAPLRLVPVVPAGAAEPRPPARPGAPDVLIVMIDTWRWDATGLADSRLATTPRLVELSAESATVFRRATAPAPSTLATVKGMVTGRPASHFGIRGWGNRPPPADTWTLARALRAAGYRGAGFTANSLVSGAGFEAGFDRYWSAGGLDNLRRSFFLGGLVAGGDYWRQVLLANALGVHKVDGDTLLDAFEAWLGEATFGAPRFTYLHLIEPHFPYRDHGSGLVPEPLRELPRPVSHVDLGRLPHGDPRNGALRGTPELEEMRGRYLEEVREADRLLGRALDALERRGLAESTLVVVVGDHGEEFFEHDAFGHGHDVWEELVHVPLVVRWPRGLPGESPAVMETPVSLLDLPPTLAELLALPAAPEPWVGRSLVPLLAGDAADSPVCAESVFRGEVRVACREGDWKARFRFAAADLPSQADAPELFDLGADASERAPLPLASADVAAALERLAAASDLWWHPARVATARLAAAAEEAAEADEARERLRALGYL